VRVGIAGAAFDCVQSGLFRLLCMASQRQHPCQVDPGIGEARVQLHCRPVAVGTFGKAAGIPQHVAQIVVCTDTPRIQFQCAARGGFGFGQATL
jgi:hypothetical protein